MYKHAIQLFLMALLISCSTAKMKNNIPEDVNISFTSQPELILKNWIEKSPLEIYVHPDISPSEPPKVLFVPFRMTQETTNYMTIGRNVSYIVWQNWVQNKIFSILEFSDTTTPYRTDIALAVAAQKGADLVVGGYITDFIDGGTVGETRVSLAIEIYDVQTGALLWSMAQAGLIQPSKVHDYIIFATKKRMPTVPVNAIVSALATDMALHIKKWVYPVYTAPTKKILPNDPPL